MLQEWAVMCQFAATTRSVDSAAVSIGSLSFTGEWSSLRVSRMNKSKSFPNDQVSFRVTCVSQRQLQLKL